MTATANVEKAGTRYKKAIVRIVEVGIWIAGWPQKAILESISRSATKMVSCMSSNTM